MTVKLQFLALTMTAGTLVAATVVGPQSNAAPVAAPVQAAGDAAKGAKLFLQCRACHTVEAGGRNTVGPNLAGIMGSKAGTRAGFNYSPALKNSKLTWDKGTMDAWLTRPAKLVPGNKMAFAGMSNPQARADVIAYLGSLKGK